MNKALFVVFLIEIGIAAAQTPPDQSRQIERDKEAMRRAARFSASQKYWVADADFGAADHHPPAAA